MNVLFVAKYPLPLHHGTALRVYHLARILSEKKHKISLLTDYDEDDTKKYEALGVEVHHVSKRENGHGKPYPHNRELSLELSGLCKGKDAAVLFGAEMLQYSSALQSSKSTVIADIIDDPILAAWRRLKKASTLRHLVWNIMLLFELRKYEKRYLPFVDACTFVTEVDANNFYRRNKNTYIKTIPNGVDLDAWNIPFKRPYNFDYCIFAGNLSFVPNHTAAKFLVKKIAPAVWRERPEIRFVIVGSNPPKWLKNYTDKRVIATGFVEDVRPYVLGARLVIIPMVTGTGIKNKLLEAWAAQKPVVATPLARQGLPAKDGQNILIRKSELEISQAICKAWTDDDLRKKLGEMGRITVETQFSWEEVSKKLEGLIHGL